MARRTLGIELFEQAAGMEKSEYSWRSDWPLAALHGDQKRESIFAKRAAFCAEYVQKKQQQELFPIETDNEIALFSCGLLCGK